MSEEKRYVGFHEILENEVKNYEGDMMELVQCLPWFFDILCELLDAGIGRDHRINVCCALATLVSPSDTIPDEVYRPMGYMDDLFLAALVLKTVKETYGVETLQKYWKGEGDAGEVVDMVYEKTSAIIDEQELRMEILKYVGLDKSF